MKETIVKCPCCEHDLYYIQRIYEKWTVMSPYNPEDPAMDELIDISIDDEYEPFFLCEFCEKEFFPDLTERKQNIETLSIDNPQPTKQNTDD